MQKFDQNLPISDAEWEVMRVLWAHPGIHSKDISIVLANKFNWKESTVKTLLGRLVNKDAVRTKKEGRKYAYDANLNERALLSQESAHLLAKICQKDHGALLALMMDQAYLSQSDIDTLSSQLNQRKKDAPETVACCCQPGQCRCQNPWTKQKD